MRSVVIRELLRLLGTLSPINEDMQVAFRAAVYMELGKALIEALLKLKA